MYLFYVKLFDAVTVGRIYDYNIVAAHLNMMMFLNNKHTKDNSLLNALLLVNKTGNQ